MLAQTPPVARSTRTSSGLKDRLPYSCSPMAIQEKKKKKKERSQDSKQEIHLESLERSDATV